MRLPLVLAVSIAANAVLLAALTLQPSDTPVAPIGSAAAAADASSAAAPAKPSAASAVRKAKSGGKTHPDLWAKLQTSDLHDLIARLRAAGFPPEVIRAVIGAELDAQYAPRYQAISGKMWTTEFWKPDPATLGSAVVAQEELMVLYRERAKIQRELLMREDLNDNAEAGAALRRRYGDLPQARIDLVRQVEDDYSDMVAQVRAATQGVTLPEDREKFALLEREKHADLAAILAPDELADYEMRTSTITARLRTALTIMDATEQEFRAIYDASRPLQDILYPTSTSSITTSADMEARRAAQARIGEQLRAAIGEQRYADYVRAGDRDYQQLYRLAQRDNLPAEAIGKAYAMRDTIVAESVRIADDSALSYDEKRVALRTLAQNTRMQFTGLLGQSAAEAYAGSVNWLRYIEGGAAVTVRPDGGMSVRTVRPPQPLKR